jgi:hypothetical protein
MNVGYFSVPYNAKHARINLELLKPMKVIHETGFIKHVALDENMTVLMNGKERKALIHF